jgi:hypothetical protein
VGAVGLETVGAGLALGVTTGAAEPVTGGRVLAAVVATGATVLATRAGLGAGGAADAGGGVDAGDVVDAAGAGDVVDAGGAAGATGASVLAAADTTGVAGPVGAPGAGVLEAGEAVWPPEGAPAEDGWLGVLAAPAGALAEVAAGAGLADEEAGVPEPVSAGLAAGELVVGELVLAEPVPAELPLVEVVVGVDAAEPTAEVTGDVAEPTVDVAEPTVDVAEPSVDEVPEMVDVRVALRGDRAAVDAWAGRENSSMTTKMPAVASAACTATRAMRRAVGCMSSSPSTRHQAARLPSGGGANLAHTELPFGHHRTVRSPLGQGREVSARAPTGRDPLLGRQSGLANSSYLAQSSLVWATSRCICSTRASIESKRRVPRSRVPKSIAAWTPYRSRSCGASA